MARSMENLPHIKGAFGRGELSYSKARALTRVATPESEEDLVAMAALPPPPTWRSWCGPTGERRGPMTWGR